MEKKSLPQLVLSYLYSRLSVIILLMVCGGIIFVFTYLANFRMADTVYSLVVCAFLVICFALYDFIKVIRAHNRLYAAYAAAENTIEEIAAYGGLLGEDYTEIITKLYSELKSTIVEKNKSETEAADYYTMWTHQIKTPIAAMKLLLDGGEPDVSLLKSELFRIERYSEMALGYIRLESMNGDMLLREYDIRVITSAALKKYFMLFSRKKLTLNFEEFELKAVTDEKWLCFVIEQILSNSIKYTSDGGITIRAEENKLCISDTGTGISAEDLPRLCERGFTGYNGRMDKKSTGLGLYLCKKITSRLGHKLEIRSEINVGTTVSIDFSQEHNNE